MASLRGRIKVKPMFRPVALLLPASMVLAGVLASPQPARAQQWQDYGPRERYEALRNYQQHEQQPQERRERVEKNYERWRTMPEQQRDRMRQQYQRFQQLPPEQRQRLQHQQRGGG